MLPASRGDRLRVYVVWLPRLKADSELAVPQAVRSITDPRASHYWDLRLRLGTLMASVIPLPVPGPAWDVYLVYPAGVRWGDRPPEPAYWMQQLKEGASNFLDPERLAARLKEEMAAASQ